MNKIRAELQGNQSEINQENNRLKDVPSAVNEPDNDNEDDSVPSTTKRLLINRLGKCEVCANIDARYTCPKCEVKTCSLPCNQIHKKELNCNGIRDRTKYVPLRQITSMEFMSDYYFLEDCTRFVEDRKHDSLKKFTRFNKTLPIYLHKLHRAALNRKTTLKFLLQNFSRRKNNTTFYNWKENCIYWRIEWVFVNANESKYIDERCSEDKLLYSLLQKYIDPTECIHQKVPERQRLEFYQSKGISGLKILLKAENVKNCDNRFYEIDVSKTLKENLANKTIVEFPKIYLYTDPHSCGFEIIDSDDDISDELKHHEEFLQEIRKKQLQANQDGESGTSSESEDEKKGNTEKRKFKKQDLKRKKRDKSEKQPRNFLFGDNDDFSSSTASQSDDEKNK